MTQILRTWYWYYCFCFFLRPSSTAELLEPILWLTTDSVLAMSYCENDHNNTKQRQLRSKLTNPKPPFFCPTPNIFPVSKTADRPEHFRVKSCPRQEKNACQTRLAMTLLSRASLVPVRPMSGGGGGWEGGRGKQCENDPPGWRWCFCGFPTFR